MTRDEGMDRDAPQGAVDRKLDEVLGALRETYHAPPAAPPLDAMWARVERSLDARAAAAPVVPVVPVVPVAVPLAAARARRGVGYWAPWFAAAATLVIGIAIGRATARPAAPAETVANADSDPVRPRPGPERFAPDVTQPIAVVSSRVPAPHDEEQRARHAAAASPVTLVSRGAPATPDLDDIENDDAASPRHYIGQATALLIALASGSPRAQDDVRMARRATELLTTTRLMLDAPQTDPNTRALLEDLELVLTQVVRLQSESGREELRLIREALEQRDLLPRLHTAAVSGSDD